MKFDIIILHPLRHHLKDSTIGIRRASSLSLVVVPEIQPVTLARFVGLISKSFASTSDFYRYSWLPRDALLGLYLFPFFSVFKRLSLQRALQRFDRDCARLFNSGTLQCEFCHVFQDYMPLTAKAAAKSGCSVVVEQILNASPAVRQKLAQAADDWNVHLDSFGVAPSEQNNNMVLSMSSVALCPSAYVADGLMGRFFGEVLVMPYGTDVSSFMPLLKGDPEIELSIVVRANSLRKGLPYALSAFLALLETHSWHQYSGRLKIDFLGDLEMNAGLEDVLDQLRTNPRVKLTFGRRNRIEVAMLLGKAHAFLMPSLSEGMSYAVAEAAACSAALVLSEFCGYADLQDGVNAYIIADLSNRGVCESLQRVVQNRSKLFEMGEKARLSIGRRSWAEFSEQIREFYVLHLSHRQGRPV